MLVTVVLTEGAQVSTAQVKEIQEDIDNYIENNQVGWRWCWK